MHRDWTKQGKMRMLAAVFCLFVILFFPVSRGFEIDILDVGQGDAAFLRTEDGHTVFVDGGSSSVNQVGIYRILPFLKYNGVKKIDFWIVSHTDEDHISGLEEILAEGYPIDRLVFAKGMVQDEVYRELIELAEENGTQILYLTGGDILHLGTAKIHVLYPEAGISADAGGVSETGTSASTAGQSEAVAKDRGTQATDKNAASLVVWYEEGNFSAIFTGDIGSEQEQELCEVLREAYAMGQITDKSLEFYKAAHHGSKNSNSAEWLMQLRPEVSTVSCAKKNSYGHPAEEAVLHMQEARSKVFYTMDSGQIRLIMHKGKMEVRQYIGEEE